MNKASETRTGATLAIDGIRVRMRDFGMTMNEAARAFIRANPTISFHLAEELGSWPSSEPELAAFQQEWTKS